MQDTVVQWRISCNIGFGGIMIQLDRINEAYNGLMGDRFQKLTRERIDWIIEQTKELKAVLDVGCSQGIISILLAQQGKSVTGIDIQDQAIAYAKEIADSQYHDLSSTLSFICKDFLSYKSETKYDCIIIAEVLEHTKDPQLFLAKAKELLADEGVLIATVPFGLSIHPDHYSTYYLSNFFQLISDYFDVNYFNFFGKWMGLVASAKEDRNTNVSLDYLDFIREENHFLLVEQESQKTYEEIYNKLIEANTKYRDSSESSNELKQKLIEANEKYRNINELCRIFQEKYEETNENCKNTTEINCRLKENLLKSEQELEDLNGKLTQSNKLNQEYANELMIYFQNAQKDIALFQELNRLISNHQAQISFLKQENEQYRRKFSLITDTWYGKFAIACYRKLNKLTFFRRLLRGN
jgi:cyclopropane fatty-acyl-phospholipid synthase-like methyltransferase